MREREVVEEPKIQGPETLWAVKDRRECESTQLTEIETSKTTREEPI
jgi:hypothetical protein